METNELVAGQIDGQVSVAYLQSVYEEVDCPGDCNYGMSCQTCGSNSQYIGMVNVRIVPLCGQCAEFGPKGCITGKLERKYGNANTPACDEFKLKIESTK